ncbi:MAG: MMPL family transporter, partial [Fibrobacteres bacterium]|nr:MMPL family transporter [Fibrobacterota bacterium]
MQVKQKSRMETDLDKYMPQEHPAFVFSNEAEDRFTIRDGVLIAVETKDGIYNTNTLQKIKDISKQLAQMDEIDPSGINSLAEADNIIGSDGGLEVKPFFKSVPKNSEEINRLRDAVRNNDMMAGRLVSQDETTALIVAEIDDDKFSQEFYHKLLALAKELSGPEEIHVAGRPIVEGSMAYLAPKDMKRMVPIVIAVIVLVLWFFLRSIRATIATMLVVLVSTVWAFGSMAILGIPIYAVSSMIPVMLIAIGVADGIHLFHHLQHIQIINPDLVKKTVVGMMIRDMWRPVIVTSITTAVGFVSLLTSEVLPIKYFGIFTAVGVLAAMVFSLVLIPAFSMVFGIAPNRKQKNNKINNGSNTLLSRFTEASVTHPVMTLSITIVIIAGSIFGIQKVWINSSFLDNFERNSEIVRTDAFVNSKFGGTSTINVILDSDNPDTFKKPAVLSLIAEMQKEVVDNSPWVGNSFSLADYIRRMSRVMHADSIKYDAIPDNQELIAQYLLLYEMSGDPENLWKVVDGTFKTANVTMQLKSDNSKASKETLAMVEAYRKRFEEHGITLAYAGSGYKALVFTGLILEGQIKSILLSFVIVAVLLSIMLQSVKAGLIGTLPIALTAAISFGLMGWFNIALSTTTALLSSIAMGIGVDYAVHILERYRLQIWSGMSVEDAGAATIKQSGKAIFDNALVVILGFMVLLFSVFPPNRTLGMLVSLNMFL